MDEKMIELQQNNRHLDAWAPLPVTDVHDDGMDQLLPMEGKTCCDDSLMSGLADEMAAGHSDDRKIVSGRSTTGR